MIRLALPKGKIEQEVVRLLADAGISLKSSSRAYRPSLSLPGIETKILKPQNIVEMLHLGSRDIGFAGADWVKELGAEVVELLDTGLNPVKIVAACPVSLIEDGTLPKRTIVVASEYENLSLNWIKERKLDAKFVRVNGATEVFPPEDADCIIDNTATGSTLRANGLEVIDELMESSTRFYANPKVLEKREAKEIIENIVLLLNSVLEARKRVMLEVNVLAENLDSVIEILPCMRVPTVSSLHHGAGFALKAAVPRDALAKLIPLIKARGGSDIVVSTVSNIVP